MGASLDCFYQTLVEEGESIEDGSKDKVVKKALVQRFFPVESFGDQIRDAVIFLLSCRYIIGSLRNLDRPNGKEGFYEEAKFGLIRNAVMLPLELAQWAVYSELKTYKNLYCASMNVSYGFCAFQAAATLEHLEQLSIQCFEDF